MPAFSGVGRDGTLRTPGGSSTQSFSIFKYFWGKSYPHLSGLIVDLKLGIFGLVIVLTLLFEPQGLFGIYRRIKVYWKTWPFKY